MRANMPHQVKHSIVKWHCRRSLVKLTVCNIDNYSLLVMIGGTKLATTALRILSSGCSGFKSKFAYTQSAITIF